MKLSGRDLTLELGGDDVRLLQDELATIGFDVGDKEHKAAFFGPATAEAVKRFQTKFKLKATGVVDQATADVINREVDRVKPAPAAEGFMVTGLVASPQRGGVAGIDVTIVDRNVGADVVLAQAATDGRGRYAASLDPAAVDQRGKALPDLQAQVRDGEQVVAASRVAYDADRDETLDVLLPAGATVVTTEHDALTAALGAHADIELDELVEDDTRQDVTYLANKTGWDARAVALASLSTSFAKQAQEAGANALAPEHFYALMRAGVPATPDALFSLDPTTVGTTIKSAIEAEVVPATVADTLDEAIKSYAQVSAAHALDTAALPGAAKLSDLLTLSLGDDAERQRKFAEIAVAHRADPSKMWDDVAAAFDPPTVARLRLDGQLALLTLDNAPLIGALHDAHAAEKPLLATADLVTGGYHRAERWAPLVAGRVPEQIPGDNDEAREAAYSDLLAAQVRLSFPTAVLADLVTKGDVKLSADGAQQAPVGEFLAAHADAFAIGMQPIDQYVARADVEIDAGVRTQIKRLQRVYQLTPDDHTMSALLANDIDSAMKVVHYGVTGIEPLVGDIRSAQMIVSKALQVHLAVLNVASTYMTTRSAHVLGAGAQAPIVDPSAQIDALNATPPPAGSPTLEELFGSLDYCACEDCRSALSPAAYLVDLLLFADRPNNVLENPQSVLLERRPDLQHLPLTCENTNTPLPYIDVVNETLEYYVVNDLTLNGYTGHDTAEARPEDLLASPQFVSDTAYGTLKAEHFPPPLPFDRPLELLRRHFAALDTPLATAMEALRADDAVERPSPATYAWRDILIQRVGCSREEHDLLTDSTLALADVFGFPAGTSEADAIAQLSNVQAFARRLGLDYDDLVAIVKTTFVNPAAYLIPQLDRLGVTFATLAQVKAGTIADADLEPLLAAGVTVADVHQFVTDHYDAAARLILLTRIAGEPGDCSLANFALRYADPDPDAGTLAPIDFLRLGRFVRLWSKLGWSIEHTDAAISALLPGPPADLAALDDGFKALLMRLGVALDTMTRLKVKTKDLEALLTCWSAIGTTGDNSLYRRLFLSAALLKQDPVFAPDVNGIVLSDAGQTLGPHAEALRAATGLTADELALVEALIPGGAAAPLTLANVSTLYRQAWLARRLKLSVRELLALIDHTGLDPFAAPDPPTPGCTALLDLLDALHAVRLKPAQAIYLLFNEDIAGDSAPAADEVAALASTLRSGYAAIDAQFAIVDDPTGDIARQRLALVYGSDAADFLFALVNQTFSVSVEYANPTQELAPAIVAEGGPRLTYDDLDKRLTWSGVLDTATATALKAVAGAPPAFAAAVDALVTASDDQTGAFFARYPELLAPYQAYATSTDPDAVRRAALLAEFLPALVTTRKLQQALAVLAGVLKADPALVGAICTDAAVMHANHDATQPAAADLTAIGTPGLSAQLFFAATVGGAPDATAVAVVDYGPRATALPHAAPISGVWSGFLQPPASGDFALALDGDATTVTLSLADADLALDTDGTRRRTHDPLALTAGELYPISLTAEGIATELHLRWESAGNGWQVVPGTQLYPQTATDDLRATYVRALKAASLALVAAATPDELAWLATAGAAPGWLNLLRADGRADAPGEAQLLGALRAVLAFAALKAALSPDDERLLAVLKAPAAVDADGASPLLTLTGWPGDSLDVLLGRFGKTRADLADLTTFARASDAFAVLSDLGTSADAALAATTNAPTGDVVAAFQSAVRARYEEADWLAVLRPINDEVRSLARDALVAYVLRRLSENPATAAIDTADKLFEYFLMDVEMDPCMLTSRIRHALSSVQLFLERCLMNLEPRVDPSSIDAAQWAWMKRYRVWEANRKVYLWPENCLESELRDDQSPPFKDVMSKLLQGDITDDAAQAALTDYLGALREVARLEPCGIFVDEQDPGTADDVVHVVGAHDRRDARLLLPPSRVRLLDAMGADEAPDRGCAGDPGRVEGARVRAVGQGRQADADRCRGAAPDDDARRRDRRPGLDAIKSDSAHDAMTKTTKTHAQAILCYSEYVNGKWGPAKTSDPGLPTDLGAFSSAGNGAFSRLALRLGTSAESGDLTVSISGQGGSRFRLYNTESAPVRKEDIDEDDFIVISFVGLSASRTLTTTRKELQAQYYPARIWSLFSGDELDRDILTAPLALAVVWPRQSLSGPWTAPFFVADARHSFYVETTQSTVSVLEFNGYGVGHGGAVAQKPHIPDVIWSEDPRLKRPPDPWGPVEKGSGVIDPNPAQLGVSEDAYIDKALGAVGAVKFGQSLIGPIGRDRRPRGDPGMSNIKQYGYHAVSDINLLAPVFTFRQDTRFTYDFQQLLPPVRRAAARRSSTAARSTTSSTRRRSR